MDAKRMTTKIIKEGIAKGNYEITGILETCEIVIAVLSDTEIEILNTVKKHGDVKKFIDIKGRPANEILQVYKQKVCKKGDRCIKNGLRFRGK
ncbi:hypothetical protein CGQ39_12540 [Clostridium botulinum]|uniref:hypothetical protein n=1 Tax=Clostridium botulinum TaxID=1491 RepID=UPI000463A732|nr:hypothetical protein [Clostridium botulinum]QDY21744.1 hypothetical protein CGQ39_12540 [Clostridium botulinum]